MGNYISSIQELPLIAEGEDLTVKKKPLIFLPPLGGTLVGIPRK
jgi:hypothetical protein